MTSARTLVATLVVLFFSIQVPSLARDVTVTWDPNSESDLKGYRLYFGTEPRGCVYSPLDDSFTYGGAPAAQGGSPIVIFLEDLEDPQTPTYTLVSLPSEGNIAFAVTSLSESGLESAYSDEASLDPSPPVLCNASAPSATETVVSFNGPIDAATSTTVANYVLQESTGYLVDIHIIDYDFNTLNRVTLHTDALTEGTAYTLIVNNVTRLSHVVPIVPDSEAAFAYTDAPSLRRAVPSGHPPREIGVEFSEGVSVGTATISSNYSIDGGVSVLDAHRPPAQFVNDEERFIHLTTSEMTDGMDYILTVTGVEDKLGNAVTPYSSVPFSTLFDLEPPIPLTAHVTSPLLSPSRVYIVFNEGVDSTSAGTAANYFIDNGIIVESASVFGDGRTVALATSSHFEGQYQIVLSDISDDSGMPDNVLTNAVLSYVVIDTITDTDTDGEADFRDNCIEVANGDQRDTDGDGYGNRCDPDLDNNGIVTTADFTLFRARLFTNDPDADFDGNGIVTTADYAILRQYLSQAPGPSALAP